MVKNAFNPNIRDFNADTYEKFCSESISIFTKLHQKIARIIEKKLNICSLIENCASNIIYDSKLIFFVVIN